MKRARQVRRSCQWILAAAAMVAMASPAEADHFRFGSIEWKPRPDISPTSVEITVEHGWATSWPPFGLGVPSVGDPSPVATTTFSFGDGSTTSVDGTIVAVDIAADWFLARDTLLHTYPSVDDGGDPWLAFIQDGNRLNTLENEPANVFRLEAEIDLGIANSSPVSSIFPIIIMEENTLNMIELPLADVDGDDLTCRLATTAESFIVTQPGPPFGGAVFPLSVTSDCVLSWDTTGASAGSAWAAQIIIEESSGGSAHGRIPLDFIIEIVAASSTAPTCDSPPTPTGTINIAPGLPYSATIQGSDPDGSAVLTLNSSGLPTGASMAPGLPTSSGSPVSSVLSWTPTGADIGLHPLLFSVTDENNQAAFCSFTIEVGGVCGDGSVNSSTEQCDPPDDSLCPGECQIDCTCPGFCGDGIVLSPEECDPPSSGIEICNNGIDDDGDGRIDCRDGDCGPSRPPTCDANCVEVPPCQAIERDPAVIRFGKNDKPDFFRIHGRFVPGGLAIPELSGMSVSISNSQGVIYAATLQPGDLVASAADGKRYRFRDRLARSGGGARGGLRTVTGRFRKIKGVENFVFKVKAYGDMSLATEALMTTDFRLGVESAFLEAEWRQTGSGWLLRLSDIN